MSFSVLTYNIWFDLSDRKDRTESLCATIADSDPDILCLQEVVSDVYTDLKSLLTSYKYYFPENINKSYGCAIMSKYPIVESKDIPFRSTAMDRSLIIVSIDMPIIKKEGDYITTTKHRILAATAHFESRFKKKEINADKIDQYDETYEILEKIYSKNKTPIVFSSDTNLMPHEEENFFPGKPQNGWIDCWEVNKNSDQKFTYDYYTNNNLKLKNVGKFRSRLDRILYKSEEFKMSKYSLILGIIGMIAPSDHHGVCAQFAF